MCGFPPRLKRLRGMLSGRVSGFSIEADHRRGSFPSLSLGPIVGNIFFPLTDVSTTSGNVSLYTVILNV